MHISHNLLTISHKTFIIIIGDIMKGINLNQPITYKTASLRFFNKNECHVTRYNTDDILLMVFEGVLRFSEDGEETEVYEGEYYIQPANCRQAGHIPSTSPKYLYIHFKGIWDDRECILPQRGTFNITAFEGLMNEMDRLAHGNFNYTQRCAKFYEILSALNNKPAKTNTANEIALFIENEDLNNISLKTICQRFNFSKNHIINIFKKEYGVTPVNYINSIKLKRAKYLLMVTSDTTESIAEKSGFNDYSHFYKLFYKENNLSPAEWRKLIRYEGTAVK